MLCLDALAVAGSGTRISFAGGKFSLDFFGDSALSLSIIEEHRGWSR